MNLRHHYKTASALLICFLLHSCDGGGDGGGEDDGFGGFNLDARYDRFALEQDLTTQTSLVKTNLRITISSCQPLLAKKNLGF